MKKCWKWYNLFLTIPYINPSKTIWLIKIFFSKCRKLKKHHGANFYKMFCQDLTSHSKK